jgi:2-C-methyl-D-erythritol 4-phosphate cytidylyltransferase/2-C-methyl-D-erythritol 2,4-cyclodiphosphate synthase
MGQDMRIAALVVAAGRGLRAGGDLPKQYRAIAGRPVLSHTLLTLSQLPAIGPIQVTIHPDDRTLYADAVRDIRADVLEPVAGGATRQESVRLGLEALVASRPDAVLIHDAARPFVTAATITDVIAAIASGQGAIAGVPLADSLKRVSATQTVTAAIERDGLWRAETPQGFMFDEILAAHRRAADAGEAHHTDDASVFMAAGHRVKVVSSTGNNSKLTSAEDFAMAEMRTSGSATFDVRVGQGFDVHKLVAGDHVWLCGVRIAHDATLEGHSDADVGLHALTDALLGAIGDGDIGQHFKNTDPRWRGAASHLFLRDAAERVHRRGGRITSTDVTILAEAPKIAPHRDAMRARIAEILGIDVARVGVKATTTETLGFVGRREGIAALATATVVLP